LEDDLASAEAKIKRIAVKDAVIIHSSLILHKFHLLVKNKLNFGIEEFRGKLKTIGEFTENLIF
jgi:hypothetical protein